MDLLFIFLGAIIAGGGIVICTLEQFPVLGPLAGWPILLFGVVICLWGLIKNHRSHTRK